MLTANNTIISNALKCSPEQALKVENYINEGRMLDWNTASKQLINTITRAVNEKLLRDVPAKKKAQAKVTVTKTRKPSFGRQEAPEPPRKKGNKAPAKGTKIAQALEVYKAKINSNRNSRQDIIAALAYTMQITPQQAAGYYQSCKKKVGA